MRTYYVYIMASRSRVLYTGVTNDLARRVYEHKRSLTPGFTSRYRITRLVYFEEFGAAQGLGSRTQGAVDRTEEPHMGGLGGRLGSRHLLIDYDSFLPEPRGAVILSERAERARAKDLLVLLRRSG